MEQLQTTSDKKTFRKFRVDSICSTSDPDAFLNEAGLDDFVAGKATGTASSATKKAGAKAKYHLNPTKAGRLKRLDKKEKDQERKERVKELKFELAVLKKQQSSGFKLDDKGRPIEDEEGNKVKLSKKSKDNMKDRIKSKQIQIKKTRLSEARFRKDDGDIISTMREIVKKGQYKKIKLNDRSTVSVDMMTASAISQVHDALNKRNQVKFVSVLSKNRAGFHKMAGFAIKNVSY